VVVVTVTAAGLRLLAAAGFFFFRLEEEEEAAGLSFRHFCGAGATARAHHRNALAIPSWISVRVPVSISPTPMYVLDTCLINYI